MRTQELDEIATNELIKVRVAPAAVVGVAIRRRSGWKVYTGASGSITRGGVDGTGGVHPGTRFDLASVSKPFLAVLCATLVEKGELSWETHLGALLPEAQATPVENAPIELLLSHRAGLEAHVRLYSPLSERQPIRKATALRQAASSMRPGCSALTKGQQHAPVYSDLGYILVGAGLERARRTALDALLAQHVLQPLGLDIGSARQFLKQGAFKQAVAPTEVVPWRGKQLRGLVHDDNCWALVGHGYAGHAGLFAAIEPLLRFGGLLVDAVNRTDNAFLKQHSVTTLTKRRAGGTLRCGFDGKAEVGASTGPTAGPNTFGHLGFTGTSIWCDPEAQLVTVVLSNRVNPTRNNQRIRAARPVVHERLALFATNVHS
jgi:CubicO group peptidase (beta-lactamase class C family)